ncbi:MAG: VOC family protein [Nitrospinota bacterium]
MPEHLGVHHVTLLVTDLERARRFYGRVLGLAQEENIPNFGAPLMWYRVGTTQIHLLPKEYVPVNHYQNLSSLAWNRHVAIGVEDFSEVRDRLQEAGVPYCENPNAHLGLKQLFFQDPDGNGLEFMVPATFEEAARKARETAARA